MWISFQKFLPYRLQDMYLAFELTYKNLALQKTKMLHFTKSHFYEKNVHVGGASLDSFFKASWLHV